jgi:hypothetical protein
MSSPAALSARSRPFSMGLDQRSGAPHSWQRRACGWAAPQFVQVVVGKARGSLASCMFMVLKSANQSAKKAH